MFHTCHCHFQKYLFLIRRTCLTTHPPVLYTMPNNALCSQPMILSDSDVDQLVQVLLTHPSPRNGEFSSQHVPTLTNITLRNTTLSLPELVNLLRWQPSLEVLSIHNPHLTIHGVVRVQSPSLILGTKIDHHRQPGVLACGYFCRLCRQSSLHLPAR